MNILIVGGGGREHAVVKALKKNKKVEKIYALPGNGGIAKEEGAECFPIKATDLDGIVAFAETHQIDFAAITQDDPLVMGCVDRLEELGIPCFGPTKAAAIIEGSKVYSKDLMKKYGIPTAASETFTDAKAAKEYLKTCDYPTVVKADGLAAGKGAIIVESYEEAEKTVDDIMVKKVFGASGNKILIEEFLTGPEVSVLSFTDGKVIVPMVSSMDHKRAKDNDEGLNTGGMGTVAPNPYYTEEVQKECMEKIFLPTVKALNKEGRTFKGCIFFGLMLTPKGAKVIEYNCRFGDPETQVVLPLLDADLVDIFEAVYNGTLADIDIKWKNECCSCVVMASGGYPKSYPKGLEMSGMDENGQVDGVFVYHAGTKYADGKFYTNGGRVIGVTATGETLQAALDKSYAAVKKISFENAHYRTDIGKRALNK